MYRVYPNRRVASDCTSQILQSVSAVKYIFNFCHYVLWHRVLLLISVLLKEIKKIMYWLCNQKSLIYKVLSGKASICKYFSKNYILIIFYYKKSRCLISHK